jgi:acetyl/propionyl-CoA carboxylase alpha subunit
MDAAVYRGLEITPFYDSMVGKLIVHGEDRPHAIARMKRALEELRLVGITTSAPVALRVLDDPRFVSGNYDTSILEGMSRAPAPETVEMAALAAAAAKFLMVRQKADAPAAGGNAKSPWQLVDRLERMGGKVR